MSYKSGQGLAALEREGLDAAYALYKAPAAANEGYEERTIKDIVAKTLKYGGLSEKQAAFLHRLLGQIAGRPARDAQRAADHDRALPVPVGHQTIEGTVVSVKIKEGGRYADTLKMTVKHDDGWLVWGSVPACLGTVNDFARERDCVKRGDRVRFTATVERSDGDAKFGFFKFPKNAALILEKSANKELEAAMAAAVDEQLGFVKGGDQ